MPGLSGSGIRARRLALLAGAAVVIGASFYAGLWAYDRFYAAGPAPELVKLQPLPALEPITRSSYVIAPVAISINAIRESMEAAAPRELLGKNDNPVSSLLSAADIGITVERAPLAMSGQPDDLAVSTEITGALKVTGQIATQAGNLVGSLAGMIDNALKNDKSGGRNSSNDDSIGGFISDLFGNKNDSGKKSGGSDVGKTVGEMTTKVLDQRINVRGQVIVHSRPALTENWRLQPNLRAQLQLGDSALQLAGLNVNMTQEARPLIDGMVNEQIANLEKWLRDAPFIEQAAREEWAKACRAIALGGGDTGLPQLWLEMRPVRAAAAQPRIDAQNVTLTIGVLAETRITAAANKPNCPFPAKLELVQPMDEGRLQIGMPIDVPFTELDKLLEAQLKGHRYPEDNSTPVDIEVRRVRIGASGERLLITLDVTAHEKKSWFGFGVNATVQIWGKPVLDAQNQILRLTDLSVAVDSSAAFGLLSAAARAAIPYVQKALAEHAVIDLKPFAADALKKIGSALAEFEQTGDDVRVSAAVTGIRLVGIAFDSSSLRVIGEADGNARVAVTRLPAM